MHSVIVKVKPPQLQLCNHSILIFLFSLTAACEKNIVMESHLYTCMACLALTHNFMWSRWNSQSNSCSAVLLMREIIDQRKPVTQIYDLVFGRIFLNHSFLNFRHHFQLFLSQRWRLIFSNVAKFRPVSMQLHCLIQRYKLSLTTKWKQFHISITYVDLFSLQ